eukprot:m51a1_g127 putative protein kinase domain containing protein (967) ;mRNA; r:427336-430596
MRPNALAVAVVAVAVVLSRFSGAGAAYAPVRVDMEAAPDAGAAQAVPLVVAGRSTTAAGAPLAVGVARGAVSMTWSLSGANASAVSYRVCVSVLARVLQPAGSYVCMDPASQARLSPAALDSSFGLSLPAAGIVPLAPARFALWKNCTEHVVAVVRLAFSFEGSGTPAAAYDDAVVHLQWECRVPGCSAACAAPRGRCLGSAGGCECSDGWVGENCEVRWDRGSLRLCPGNVFQSRFEIAPGSASGRQQVVLVRPDGTQIYRDFLGAVYGNISLPIFMVPGTYSVCIFANDSSHSLLGCAPLLVMPWENCSVATHCALPAGSQWTGALAPCKGNSTCDPETGRCLCPSTRFFPDCSHGCDAEITLNGENGMIASDEGAKSQSEAMYARAIKCVWNIRPHSNLPVRIVFSWLDLNYGDRVQLMLPGPGQSSVSLSRGDSFATSGFTIDAGGFAIAFQSGFAASGHGFRMYYRTVEPHESMPVGKRVAIAMSVVVFLVLVIAVLAAVAWMKYHHNCKRDSSPAGVWPLHEEELEQSEQAPAAILDEALRAIGVNVTKSELLFGLAPLETCPVAQIKLNYTTSVKRRIKMVVAPLAGGATPVCKYLSINLQGAISELLDPDEIIIDTAPLGVGAFGVVYRGVYKKRMVAVKVLRRQDQLTQRDLESFHKEVDLYKRLRNPFIVEFVGASRVPGKLCICSEIMEMGSLQNFLFKYSIPIRLQLRFAHNLCEAMSFLHANNILYRDLKPSNVMVVSPSCRARVNCKLGDFGTAKNVEDSKRFYDHTVGIGTPLFMAPEILMRASYNNKVDVYAFGILMWQMAAGEVSWPNVSLFELPDLVIKGIRPTIPEACPASYKLIITGCWDQKPENRPEFFQLLAKLGHCKKDTKKERVMPRNRSFLSLQMIAGATDALPFTRKCLQQIKGTTLVEKKPSEDATQTQTLFGNTTESFSFSESEDEGAAPAGDNSQSS